MDENEEIPADLIILATSNEDALCYVQTSNLDGETNLKTRFALPATAAHVETKEHLKLLKGGTIIILSRFRVRKQIFLPFSRCFTVVLKIVRVVR